MSRRAAWTGLSFSLLALPVAAWWLIGDLSEAGGSDYMFRAPPFAEDHEQLIGMLATLVLVGCSVLFLSPARRAALERRDARAAVPLACLGIFLGFAYRVMTAAVGGANIGGGLMFMFGVAFVPSMLLLALVQLRRRSRADR